jgi:hypothetical protein
MALLNRFHCKECANYILPGTGYFIRGYAYCRECGDVIVDSITLMIKGDK